MFNEITSLYKEKKGSILEFCLTISWSCYFSALSNAFFIALIIITAILEFFGEASLLETLPSYHYLSFTLKL